MKFRLRYLGIAVLLMATATSASATSFVMSLNATGKALKGTSDTTTDAVSSSSGNDKKMIEMARGDATSFVATNGDIRGAALEQALGYFRDPQHHMVGTDLQIAEAIVVAPE